MAGTPFAALRAESATVTIRFIPGETGCLKVFAHPHFGDSFSAKWRCFSSLKDWILDRQVSFEMMSHPDRRI
jgi:hypothetical protein